MELFIKQDDKPIRQAAEYDFLIDKHTRQVVEYIA